MVSTEVDGQPLISFPHFDNSENAYAFALKMEPMPTEFVTTTAAGDAGHLGRRMRIRVHEEVEQQPEAAPTNKKSLRSMGERQARALARRTGAGEADVQAQAPKERKSQYIVEATGLGLFEMPTTLRDLKEVPTRYYIALAAEKLPTVLVEGFKVFRRTSIPCSATPQEAIDRWRQAEPPQENPGHSPPTPAVLIVNVPPNIDVVAHKSVPGGYLIMAQELPASCLKERRKQMCGQVKGPDA